MEKLKVHKVQEIVHRLRLKQPLGEPTFTNLAKIGRLGDRGRVTIGIPGDYLDIGGSRSSALSDDLSVIQRRQYVRPGRSRC